VRCPMAESAGLVAPIVIEREAVLTSLRGNSGNPDCDSRAYGAWRGTECVGAAVLDLPHRDNAHLAEIELGVPPRARNRGVGLAMFALACGFRSRHSELRLLLNVPVPGDRLLALEETAAKRAGEYHLAGWTGVPPADVLQNNTFVLRSCRGRGLGTLAKIANLRLLARHFPQARHVHTWTAQLNDAMHAVNARLGFRPMETTHELELELD
jgi:GNAT superfamily N-acetyltransferase